MTGKHSPGYLAAYAAATREARPPLNYLICAPCRRGGDHR